MEHQEHHKEQKENSNPHISSTAAKLNWLRASVLGANDGIVSVAGIVAGVAGATNNAQIILTAGMAGLIAGAISMAAGEYVSVSSSRDTERALLKKEKYEIENNPKGELEELACIYESKGLSHETAMRVAKELSKKDAYAAHIDAELGINPDDLINPWHAAFASAVSFTVGALIPLIAVILTPQHLKIPVTFIAVILALIITGTTSAKIGKASVGRAVVRVVIGGAIAMIVTYGIGRLFNLSSI
ncbi:MAG: VIT1/CCC1 transporter family protein [Candidatus Levyibacteriota bacterium]